MTEAVAGRRTRASIVIPVFNNLALTKDCLNSISACTSSGTYEVIVVDNGSTDGSWDYLHSLQPRIRCLRNPRNMFFARGCNRGAWAAAAEYVVFLNNDTLVKPGWLEGLLRPLDEDATIGIVGNKQLFPDNRVWHAGTVIGEDKLPWHICYGFDRAHPAVNRERDSATVSGCCFAIRRDLFKQLRGFDPHFENGFEDADLCLRVRAMGHRVVYAPQSEIVHLVSRTEGRFDREDLNREKFKARWSDKVVPDEREFLREAGFLSRRSDEVYSSVPSPSGRGCRDSRLAGATGEGPNLKVGPSSGLSGHLLADSAAAVARKRIGLITPANSRRAEPLIESLPKDSCIVLTEFGTTDQCSIRNIPCWDRSGQWFYPLLRWATTLDLDLIQIDFDGSVFPPTFTELLQALKQAGKHLVVSMHRSEDRTALAAGITQLADSIVVPTQKIRVHLIRMGVPPSKIEVISACGVEQYPRVYHDLLTRRGLGRARVRWEGPQLVNHSLALVNREMELALLQQRNVELTIAPTLPDTFTQSLNSRVSEIPIHYGCSLTGPADVHIRHQWPPNWQPPQEGRWVVIQPWEYGALPEEWVRPINRDVDEVWAPSTFVRNLYLESGVDAARVCVVPNGVDADFFKPGGRPYPLKSAKKFKFLFLGGTIHRKGIDVLLDAYCRAFTTADDVSLVIKDMGASGIYRGQGMGDRIRQLQSQANVPHILYLDRDLTDDQMVQLYNACDCLVHPYRGEGFALPVLEAMSCALPVVVTAGGATDDFVDDKTGYRIPARRQVFGNRAISGLKTVGDLWLLEPDIEALIQTLTRVFRNAEEARDVGKRARLKVESGWTWKHAADIAASRIEELRSRPILRHLKPVDAAVWIEGVGDDELADIVESVKRHTYGSVALFARSSKASHPEIQPLDGDFTSALRQIRSQVRAPFTAVVTGNIRFSKHWLSQLADVTRAVGEVSAIVLPSMEIRESSEISDAEFQKMARVRWRERRGTYRRSAEVNPACALVTSNCLAVDMEAHNAEDWLTRLQHHGVPAYVAEDTLVACLPMERAMTHHA